MEIAEGIKVSGAIANGGRDELEWTDVGFTPEQRQEIETRFDEGRSDFELTVVNSRPPSGEIDDQEGTAQVNQAGRARTTRLTRLG